MRSSFSWALSILASLPILSVALSPHPLVAQTATAAQCIDCHTKTTPNIVSDWKLSKHSQLEVSCVVCHGDQHTSASDVAKVKIPDAGNLRSSATQTQVAQFHEGQAFDGLGRDECYADHPLAADGHDRRTEGLRRMSQDRREEL